jgi:methyl-accepting chemotaxis protein
MRKRFTLNQWSIKQRLSIGFALAGLLAIVVVLGAGIVNTANFHQATTSFDLALTSSASLGQIRADIEGIHGTVADQLLFGDPVSISSTFARQMNELCNDVDQQVNAYFGAVGQDNPLLDRLVNDWSVYRVTVLLVVGDLESGLPLPLTDARSLVAQEGQTQFSTIEQDLDRLVTFNQEQIANAHNTLSQSNTAAVEWPLVWALAGFGVIIVLAWVIITSILRQLGRLLRLIHLINAGDLQQRAHIPGHHEVAVVAAAMNEMLDTILQLLRKEETWRQELEEELERFIEQVSPIGQGDLRSQAEVTSGQLGTLADVFNQVVEQLATLVSRVHSSASLTAIAANSLVQQATQLAQGAEQQATQLIQANEEMEQVATTAANVARLARSSVVSANQTVSSARYGGEAALKVLERVKHSVEQVQIVEEQMRVLSHHSQEITTIVALIEGIAQQTQLLSLNAEVQAEQANREFRKGFWMVAEEIRGLAEHTEESGQQIRTLVRTVQGDIYSVKLATEQMATGFADLARLADEAGQVLRAIWVRVTQQAKEIESIATTASWQEAAAGKAAGMAQRLATMAKQMGQIAHMQDKSATNLAEVSQVLQTSVAAFRLPLPPFPGLATGHTHSGLLPLPRESANNPQGNIARELYKQAE